MRVVYIGNFEPEHSTENHVRRALTNNGHDVVAMQESSRDVWQQLADPGFWRVQQPGFVLWTRTRWPWLGDPVYGELQWKMLALTSRLSIPTVGFHLDRWWGLARQHEVTTEPFFRVDLLVTADGGHDDLFAAAGIDHVWMPPGVSAGETDLGRFRAEWASDIAFVGSWRSYHPEWQHRRELVDFLSRTYGDRIQFWPRVGSPAMRGDDLRDLYASVKVLVGDSCLAPRPDGKPVTRYCSDRIPETLGRGGLLIHPEVEGVTDGPWQAGKHLACWTMGDWRGLQATIDGLLEDEAGRKRVAKAGRSHTVKNHTYERRMGRVVDLVTERFG